MNLPHLTLKSATHNNTQVVQLLFEKNEALLQLLKTDKNLRWSKTMACWYLPYSAKLKQDLFLLLKGKTWINYDGLKDVMVLNEYENINTELKIANATNQLQNLSEETEKKINEFKDWMRSKRYSDSTVGTYTDALRTFLRYHSGTEINNISNGDLIKFNNDYILKNKLSSSFQNQVVNAIKLFFRTIENKQLEPELIHRPKRAKLLPNVLSKEEVKAILNAHNNIKHRAMLSLIYSCGLRCGELLKLKPEHVDSRRNLLIIKQAKGRKDRIVPLSLKILELLREYYIACKPTNYLFEGQKKGEPYDERSLQNVLKQSLQKVNINKPVSLHWLRHSYATHLLENGTDLRYIQEILGHSRSTTTEIYTYVSNKSIQKVISPFDTL